MESAYSPVVLSNSVVFKTIAVDAINVAYQEAGGDPTHPKSVLLHGWPASSHQLSTLDSEAV
jgi:pimeloyl-ACP methyl ester carboxylesterase